MSSEKRKPNWTLCVKEGEKWRSIGAAWETERGNLFVKLDEGQVLRGTAMFFPYREKPSVPRPYSREEAKHRAGPPIAQPATRESDSDYMGRKRAERAAAKSPPLPPTPPGEYDPDPEAPDWL